MRSGGGGGGAGLESRAAAGGVERPVVIHYAIYGSFERFIGIITEHYARAFPFWCAPAQAVVVPIADRHLDAAGELAGVPRARGLRVEADNSSNRMQNKIRLAQEQKVPYMLVFGDREAEARTASPRTRGGGQQPAGGWAGRGERPWAGGGWRSGGRRRRPRGGRTERVRLAPNTFGSRCGSRKARAIVPRATDAESRPCSRACRPPNARKRNEPESRPAHQRDDPRPAGAGGGRRREPARGDAHRRGSQARAGEGGRPRRGGSPGPPPACWPAPKKKRSRGAVRRGPAATSGRSSSRRSASARRSARVISIPRSAAPPSSWRTATGSRSRVASADAS